MRSLFVSNHHWTLPAVALMAAVLTVSACSEFGENADVSGEVTAPDVGLADGAVDTLSDTASPDVASPDVSSDSVWLPDADVPPGAFGAPCTDNVDCDSGVCIVGPNGNMCTKNCIEECPAGFSCKGISVGSDPIFVCIYDHVPYCRPCDADTDCAHPQVSGQGNVCLDTGDGSGSFCATRCEGGPCPPGSTCETVDRDGETLEVCRPAGGNACTCSPWAVENGATTTCVASNSVGTCEGIRMCDSTGLTACDAPVPVEELCNDLDDDCDGATDETFSAKGEACDGDDADQCDDGVQVCTPEGTLVCDDDADSSIEICNDVDDDCDGDTDEDFTDKGAACDGNDLDLCADGVFVCDQGGLACDDDEASAIEICNDLDDDCDGETDEDFTDKGTACDGPDADSCAFGVWACDLTDGTLICANDTAQATFTDLDGTSDLAPGDACGAGACVGGTVVCNEGAAVTCSSWDQITEEICDGLDNDCDGLIDEDFAPGGSVTFDDGLGNQLALGELCGVGACAGGEVVCGADGQSLECTTSGDASPDICDGLDNDCDGDIDEDFKDGGTVKYTDLNGTTGLVLGSNCGVGACAGGEVVCGADQSSLTCSTAASSGDDICDGVDNDCDGLIDEPYKAGGSVTYNGPDGTTGLVLGQPCGSGLCAGGNVVCGGDNVTLTCSTAAAAGSDVCDNLDNDCDGITDNDFVDGTITYDDPGGTAGLLKGDTCGTGACNGGVVICSSNQQALTCTNAPGGGEICDGVDNDCNGETDEGCDDDGDGYCDADLAYVPPADGSPLGTCPQGTGDCDDTTDTVSPAEIEVCDNIDQNCVGGVDEGCDNDGDGFCDADMVIVGTPDICPNGGGDCDDQKLAIKPNATEICDNFDNNCDEAVDEGCDDDGDNFCDSSIVVVGLPAVCPNGGGDCNDEEPTAYLGAPELCDDLDNNCFGGVDEGCDNDGDDYCNFALTVVGNPAVCPNGPGDCNDVNGNINPGASEICDSLDNNCGGGVDEGCDDDGDGFCDANIVLTVSFVCPLGGGDCNDDAILVNPNAPEICDDIDNNCGAGTDEGCDDDNDDYCDATIAIVGTPVACPNGGGDCDDGDDDIKPGADEICDNINNNCAGGVDEGCDDDNDNYCDSGKVVVGTPATCTAGGGDCADEDNTINPGATEACDDVDNDCNTDVDEGCDNDGDGFCDANLDLVGTPAICPNGGGDCVDTNDAIKPSAPEICDDVDNNCLGGVDEGCDVDGDKYCAAGAVVSGTPAACANGTGDCNDVDPEINPGATEVCDDEDNNCINGVDEGCDDDGDDYCDLSMTTVGNPNTCFKGGGDCNDGEQFINPGAVDLCDAIDNNCNGVTDDPYIDGTITYDDDPSGPGLVKGEACGVGACSGGVVVCGQDNVSLDCTTAGAGEICDGLDNDCNGITDDGCDVDGDDYCDANKVVIGTPAVCPFGGGDCADNDGTINPGVTERCDAIDNNCILGIDEGCDDDGDDYCDANMDTQGTPPACPNGGGDCVDSNDAINPGATEICDDLNNNCTGGVDEGCDNDNDNYCDINMVTVGAPAVCPLGPGDCNDTANGVNPGAAEICDDIDNDCGEGTDEGCDDDNDGYCDSGMTLSPGGASTCGFGGGDCDDNSAAVNPGGTEVCDNINNNCAGGVDEGCDDDNDNYCDSGMAIVGTPSTCTDGGGDCNDTNPNVNPGEPEDCNGIDDNCGGGTDENLTPPLNDNQNGLCGGTVKSCTGPGGWVNDYSSVGTYNQNEVPDGSFVDENCDGIDGDVTNGIFVSGSDNVGNTSSCGLTKETACATIGYGLSRATTTGRDHVYVQAGTYNETIELANNKQIYGGFNGSWVRKSRGTGGHTVTISGGYNSSAAQYITLRGVNDTATVADLNVTAANSTSRLSNAQGKSSYGVHARGGAVTITRCTITQGNGYSGAGGSDGSAASTLKAAGGGNGGDAREYVTNCDTSRRNGGSGGSKSCGGYATSGGTGGKGGQMDTSCGWTGFCSNCNATGGLSGGQGCYNSSCSNSTFVATGGTGGSSAGTCADGNGGNPGNVTDGSSGSGAGTKGRLISYYWYGKDGSTGNLGKHGGGGGGGGGSGGCDSGTDSYGAGGGGGGAGGCRAPTGGAGGKGAGGSFGVFGYQSTLNITGCTFVRGTGGGGGSGGDGKAGQPGGDGGDGGDADGDSGPGGDGGNGGRGGHSAGGGGGAGGVSYGIFRYQGSLNSNASTSNAFQSGTGGSGGGGGASPGNNGSGGSGGGAAVSIGTCSSTSGC